MNENDFAQLAALRNKRQGKRRTDTDDINLIGLNRDMRELILVRLDPHCLRYFVHQQTQSFVYDAFKDMANDENGIIKVLRTIGYTERELSSEMIARVLVAYVKDRTR
jgi:hypothetical protein